MNLAAKITWGLSALTIVGLAALAAPAVASTVQAVTPVVETAASAASAADETPEPYPAERDAAAKADLPPGYVYLGQGLSIPEGGPGDCTTNGFINIMSHDDGPAHATLLGGPLVDMGPQPGATGEVVTDAEGIRAYVVASGDWPEAIGERLCIDYVTVTSFNNVQGPITPGQVLTVRPDPAAEWVGFWEDAPTG